MIYLELPSVLILDDSDVADDGVVLEWQRPVALKLGKAKSASLHAVDRILVDGDLVKKKRLTSGETR